MASIFLREAPLLSAVLRLEQQVGLLLPARMAPMILSRSCHAMAGPVKEVAPTLMALVLRLRDEDRMVC